MFAFFLAFTSRIVDHLSPDVNGYTLSGQICSAQLVTSEPDQSLYPYPDKIKGNLARIAVDIERFALTWSKVRSGYGAACHN